MCVDILIGLIVHECEQGYNYFLERAADAGDRNEGTVTDVDSLGGDFSPLDPAGCDSVNAGSLSAASAGERKDEEPPELPPSVAEVRADAGPNLLLSLLLFPPWLPPLLRSSVPTTQFFSSTGAFTHG